VSAPALGHTDRVSVVEVTPRYVTVRLKTPAVGFGNEPFRRIFGAFVDEALLPYLLPSLEVQIVYERFAHGVAYFLRPVQS
jgi:hypothetical protein